MGEPRSGSRVTLYVIPVSHPSRAARLMLEQKRIEHRVVTLVSGLHPVWLRAMGFRRGTVPALRLGRRHVQGSLNISRALDELVPSPPLFPAKARARGLVEQAERWGADELQPLARRLYRWALVQDFDLRRTLAKLNRLPLAGLSAVVMKPLAAYFAHLSNARDSTVRADLQRLPSLLDQVEALLREGIIGGESANAADWQIATSVRLLLTFADLEKLIGERQAGRFALQRVADYVGSVPTVFPPEWLRTDGRTGPR